MNRWVEPSVERYQAQQIVTREIDEHLEKLNRWCAGRSHHAGIEEHSSYIALIRMGDRIVNYIMHRMTQGGFRWEYYQLLRQLTGEKTPPLPHESRGNLPRIMAHIILWWVDSEYYANDNIYYGLVS